MPLRRSPDVTYEVVDDRAMLLDPAGRELITLNPVGSVVWETLDGTLDVAGITDRLLPLFDGVTRDQLAHDVELFVAELRASELIVDVDPPD
jgi:coenzyme PQQ synthesis protein D (PqqD)